MEENNQNNMDNCIPEEIPVPGVADLGPYGQPVQGSPYHVQYQHDPYQSGGSFGEPQIPPYIPNGNEKGAATKIIIAVACVCVALIAVIVGAMVYFRSTPAYKISKGLQNLGREIAQARNPMEEKIGSDAILSMMREDGSHVDTKLDFSMELPIVGTTTLGIDTDFYKDMHARELNADTRISMYNYEFAHLSIYADDAVFCFSIPELFVEDMYIENENVVSQYNDSVLADALSPSDMEDFSINFFDKGRITYQDWKSFREAFEVLEDDLNACKDAMVLEKVEKGLYRVTFPQDETDRLVRNFVREYTEAYEITGDMDIFTEYDEWISSDTRLLFEIGYGNRIESIMLEEPVEALDAEAAVAGELFFLGEGRSIDKIQGKVSVDGIDGGTREIIGQYVQDVTEDDYRVTMDFKYSDGYGNGKMKYVMNCDAVRDEFDMTISMRDDADDINVALEGGWDDIVQGESVQFHLDRLTFDMDDEELFRLSGEIGVEPLRDGIRPSAEPETAFFKMTTSDWKEIFDRLDDEYGSLLGALW